MDTALGNGLRVGRKIDALTGLYALIVAIGAGLLWTWTQTTMERDERALTSLMGQMDLARRMQVDFKKQVQEWKDILLRGHEPADFEQYRTQFVQQENLVRADGRRLRELVEPGPARTLIAAFLQTHQELGLRYRNGMEVFALGGASDYREADRLVRGADRPPTDLIDAIVDSITQEAQRQRALHAAALVRVQRLVAVAVAGILLVVLGVGMLVHSRTAQLIASRQELADFFDNATEGLHGLDPDGRVLWINQGELRASGFERVEFVGHLISEFHADPEVAQDMIDRMRRGEVLRNYEARFKCKDGSVVDLLISTDAIMRGGKLVETRCFCRNISKRKRAENALRRLNAELETRVLERTQQLEDLHRQLRDVAREAGMSDVATNVLHNVGNVLNSVNVSAHLITERVQKCGAGDLARVVAVLREHEGDLASFVTTDVKGRHLVAHLGNLAQHLETEQAAIVKEVECLRVNIEHIRDIVTMQQRYAKISGVSEVVDVVDLVEDSLRLNAGALVRHQVEVIREFHGRPLANLDKHKVLQILVNLIRNAKYACEESQCPDRQVKLGVIVEQGRVRVSVTDNGVGIARENLHRIFSHGFTTRPEGHGFGLHSGALAAKELGGTLSVHSEGLGRGASFTLELPEHVAQPISESEAA